MSDEVFYADEFFLDENDPGVQVVVKIRGRDVPIYLKRGLTLDDTMAAQAVSVKKTISEDGKVVFEGMDEGLLVREMLYRSIKSWPFTVRESGEPLPITRENVGKLLGGADKLMEAVKKLSEEGEAVLAPFAPASAAA